MSAAMHDITGDDERVMLPFPGTSHAPIEQVGGKAHSLIRLTANGHVVPPGLVLTSRFFAPWIEQIIASAAWQSLQNASAEQRPALCELLKQHAVGLPLNDIQRRAMDAMRHQLAELTSSVLFAVRSSSPQEDLLGASFAGGYATCLGVRHEGLLDAIRTCFASLFDERVIAYKAARGIGLESPSMAVVIQEQINSEIAGVAFSLNPTNNDYDEAVIDANWGLGETVVAGEVTPDNWVVDKATGTPIEQRVGSKRISRWLQPDGRLVERADYRSSEACLTTDQLTRIIDVLRRIEANFGHPVDVEWAIANDTVYLLQARPVTAFVPLPASLTTQPGQRRRLYMDVALSSGLTMNAPISPMGLDVFRRLFSGFAQIAFGPRELAPDAEDALMVLDGGRMYLDFSNVLWLSDARKMARSMELGDATMARLVEQIDPLRYKAQRRPHWARLRMLWLVPGLLWRARRVLGNFLWPFLAPQRTYRRIARQFDDFEASAVAATDDALPLDSYWNIHIADRLPWVFNVSLAVGVGPGMYAVQAFAWLAGRASRRDAELMQRLDRGFAGNVVVDMNIRMLRLACLLSAQDRSDPQVLTQRLQAGELSEVFMREWSSFLQRSGCRGPMEMDLAHPRYADAPLIALRQIAAMPVDDPHFDPAAAAHRQIERRREAAMLVIQRAGPIRRWILRRLNQVIEQFAGLRDTPKLHFLMLLQGLRRRIVLEGDKLHRAGRLDSPAQVFDLQFDELLAAADDPALDLRAVRAGRRPYYDTLTSQVSNFPPMIDSRGRIPRPTPRPCREGEFAGLGLAPGVVSGPARTLRSPHETLARGEVLIAYTTDPGWTPIFANAAAVVLEIGGALQHGAVVARELGLPCVAGIDGITKAIKDGQLIEVDGSAGLVRLLPSTAAG
jgi:pyruvate,water dikinase